MIKQISSGRDQDKDIAVFQNQYENLTQFSDTISDIQWQLQPQLSQQVTTLNNNQKSEILATSSWDGQIKVFDLNQGKLFLMAQYQFKEPVLTISFQNDDNANKIYYGLGNGEIGIYDVALNQINVIDVQEAPICKLIFDQKNQYLLCFTYDKQCILWKGNKPISKKTLLYQPFSIDYSQGILALAFEQERMLIISIQNLFQTDLQDSDYKIAETGNQLQNDASNQSINGTISLNTKYSFIGTLEGRGCALRLNNNNSCQKNIEIEKLVVFKVYAETKTSQKFNQKTEEIINHPVTNSQFHPIMENILFTAGSSGELKIWDVEIKSIIKTFTYSQPISCFKINHNGRLFAYSLGYDWNKGIDSVDKFEPPQLYVHYIEDKQDLQTK